MKILHVIPSISPRRGGPSQAVLAMVRSQCTAGLLSEILTTNDDGPSVLPVPAHHRRPIEYEGCQVNFLPRWSPRWNTLREFQFSRHATPWMEEHLGGYDCVHVHGIFSFLSTRSMQLARRYAKPYLVRPLGQLHPWSLSQSATKKRWYRRVIEDRNIRGAATVHCTSLAEAEHVQALSPGSHCCIIPHGVEAAVAKDREQCRAECSNRLGLPPGTPLILFLSRWHRKKNLGLLLDSLAHLKDRPWHLVLAGESAEENYKNTIQQRIGDLGLGQRVSTPGLVSGKDKAALFSGASFFVLPSESENFGIAVAEALIHGQPVVITDGVDLASDVRELQAGEICQATEASLTESLRHMLQSVSDWTDTRRDQLAIEAQSRFSWTSNAMRLKSEYERVVHSYHEH